MPSLVLASYHNLFANADLVEEDLGELTLSKHI
jgi:hypothetical protein